MRELRPLRPYLSRYTGTYLVGLACVVSSNVLTTLIPSLVARGVDALARPDPIHGVRQAALLLSLAAVAGGFLRYGMRQLLNTTSRRVEYDLRNDLFSKLLRLPAAFFDRTSMGDVMARATNDLLSARMVAGPALMYLVDTATRVIILLPAMFSVNATLAGLALLPLLALPAVEAILGRKIHDRSLAIQDHFGTVTEFVRQHLTGIRIVRAYSQETPETEAFARLNEEYASKNMHLARVQAANDPLLMLFGGISGVVVLLVGGRMTLDGSISAGQFVGFFLYLALLVWPLIFVGWAINLIFRATAAMARINAVFAEPETIASPTAPEALVPDRKARSIQLDDVWFRYPSAPGREWVLEGISVAVPAGRSLGIVGPTGSGKSALLELLARLYDPDRGRVLIDGIDVRRLPLASVRAAVGFVPQETFLFSESLRNNVLIGAPDDGRLAEAARISLLEAAVADLPAGYDTILGERGINLSGGQKQRAAIARALAQDPPVIVLDDALSAVDAQTEARILERLRLALTAKTRLIASHRAAAVRDCDEIIVLERGRIVERGGYQELIAKDGRFADLVRTQLIEDELERM